MPRVDLEDRGTSRATSIASPSKKSVARLKPRISAILRRGNKDPWQAVCEDVNRVLIGWARYFNYGSARRLIARSTTMWPRTCGASWSSVTGSPRTGSDASRWPSAARRDRKQYN
jgi:hypothetical protein